NSAVETFTIVDSDQAAGGPSILLTPTVLASLRQTAASNTPQWQAFKNRLDSNLNVVIADDIGSYDGEELTYIRDYALGYQILKDTDPNTATSYADKAIGLMLSGLHDRQTAGGGVAHQFLAQGDGATKTFTLANADFVPSSLFVLAADTQVLPIVHGAVN